MFTSNIKISWRDQQESHHIVKSLYLLLNTLLISIIIPYLYITFFYYRKSKNAVQARKELSDMYRENVLTERQCQN